MIEHSEFPWGPEAVPGLLTPLGLLGWLLAAVLLILLLRRGGREPAGQGARPGDAVIAWKYAAIAKAAQRAARADQDEVLKAHRTLVNVIERTLGGVQRAGGGLAAQLKLLDKARSGERDAHHDHDGDHDQGHEHDDHAKPAVAEKHGAAADTVHGPNVTVNIGVATEERPRPDKPHKPKPRPPLSLKEQLADLQEALRAFDAWWSREDERTRELKAARDALNGPPRLPPDLEKLIEGMK